MSCVNPLPHQVAAHLATIIVIVIAEGIVGITVRPIKPEAPTPSAKSSAVESPSVESPSASMEPATTSGRSR